jgi:transposase
MYDSVHDESCIQDRREPGSGQPASSAVEDYVGPDNPVRAIESFVCVLDLAKLGFRHADRCAEGMGQPPYDPADLLKLYLYVYINQIRSSRRLEREACRNLELIWLLKNLRPGYRTIANFRKENWKALKAVNRGFVLLARELGLVGGAVVAIDGSFFHGDASKASIFTRKRLSAQITKLDQEIEVYGRSLEDNDAAEAKQPRNDGHDDGGGDGADIGAKVAALMARRSRAQVDLDRLEASGDAPSFRHRRTSLRNAQMPRRLSPLPRSRLRQGARRMEPDGALLQFYPCAQYPRLRGLRGLHGKGIPIAHTRP